VAALRGSGRPPGSMENKPWCGRWAHGVAAGLGATVPGAGGPAPSTGDSRGPRPASRRSCRGRFKSSGTRRRRGRASTRAALGPSGPEWVAALPHLGHHEGAEQAGRLRRPVPPWGRAPGKPHRPRRRPSRSSTPVVPNLAHEVRSRNARSLFIQGTDHLGLPWGLAHGLVPTPETAQAHGVVGHGCHPWFAIGRIGQQPRHVGQAGAHPEVAAKRSRVRQAERQDIVGTWPPVGLEDGAEDTDQIVDDKVGIGPGPRRSATGAKAASSGSMKHGCGPRLPLGSRSRMSDDEGRLWDR